MFSQCQTATPPKRDRRRYLTKIDKRTAFGRRVMELRSVFAESLGAAEMTPLRRLKIREAAELKAIAERARGDWMRDGAGNLDDIVRIERKADLAFQALNIVEPKAKTPTLADILARHAKAEAAGA